MWHYDGDFVMRRLWKALANAARLACPRCGARTLFRGAFSMHERCAVCHLTFEREPGYFVGAIYINYAVTAVLTIGGFLVLDAWLHPSLAVQLGTWGTVAIAFPLWFFRYSRSLWLSVDYLLNPEDPPLNLVHRRS